MNVVVSGASGFIGRRVSAELRALGHTVRPLVRAPGRSGLDGGIAWDPERGSLDAARLEDVDLVINLGGAPIDRRWTDAHKRRMIESRVPGTRAIARALASATPRPRVFLSGSATGFYGDRGDALLDESVGPGKDFLAQLAVAWE